MMTGKNKILLLLLMLFCLSNACLADVYLLTDHDGVGHSILVVTKKITDANGNQTEEVIASLSKEPGNDDHIYIRDGYIVKKNGTPEDPVYDLKNQKGITTYSKSNKNKILLDYTGIKLSVEEGSDLEKRIIKEINAENNSKALWYWNNCGQGTYNVLYKSGYFSEEIRGMMDASSKSPVSVGRDWWQTGWNSPSYVESWTKVQERVYAAKKRAEVEEAEIEESEDKTNNDDEVTNPDDGGQCPVPPDDNPPPDDEVVNPRNDPDEPGNGNSDSEGGGKGAETGIIDAVGDVADYFALVGPTIPHKRILWMFSGESIGTMGMDLFNSITGNEDFLNIKSFFETSSNFEGLE